MAFRGRPKVKAPKQRSGHVERRAIRILEMWADRPSLRPGEIKLKIRAEFSCGEVASEEAMCRAHELYAEYRTDLCLVDRLASEYFALAEAAKRAGDFRGAARCLDSLRSHLGIGAAERVEITTVGPSRDPALAGLTDEQLAVMAQVEEAERAGKAN